MDIFEELEMVKSKLLNPQVDPNEIFLELEKEHTNRPSAASDKVVESIIEHFNSKHQRINISPTIDDIDSVSIISLNDSESLTDTGTGTIDLTETPDTKTNLEQGELIDIDTWNINGKEIVLDAEDEDLKRMALELDATEVLRLTEGTTRDKETVLAYLENYADRPNRVRLVVEELLGIGGGIPPDTSGFSDPPSLPSPPLPTYVGKGKGRGKGKSNRNRQPPPFQPPPIQPPPPVAQEVETAVRFPDSDEELPDLPPVTPRGQKSASLSTSLSASLTTSLQPEKEKNPSINESPKRPGSPIHKKAKAVKTGRPRRVQPVALQDTMLHGPFNFLDHRKEGSGRSDRRSSNLRPGLDSILAEVTKSRGGGKGSKRSSSTAPVTVDVDDVEPIDVELFSSRPSPPPPAAARPEVEVVGAWTEKRKNEKEALVSSLTGMFADTDPAYIRLRAEDLVGKHVAIERFTDELLNDPNPPSNWRKIYALPQQQDRGAQDVVVVDRPGTTPGGTPLSTPPPTPSDTPLPTPQDTPIPTPDNSRSTTPLPVLQDADMQLQLLEPMFTGGEDVGPASSVIQQEPQEPTAGPSSREPEVTLSPLEQFIKEKEGEMASIFPDLSPAWITEQINGIVAQQGENVDIGALAIPYQTKVEQILSLSGEEKKALPTKKEWEAAEKERLELEKWTSGMTVQVMLDLFNQDPVSYFNSETRVVEKESYRRHCLAALKSIFRHHCNNDIEKALKTGKGLFISAYKKLQTLKNTRKTRRTENECRVPTGDPCIQFLKERKYVELEDEIKAEMGRRAAERDKLVAEAKAAGQLKECLCCYNDECLEEEMILCNSNHMYCKECVARGANVAIGDGKTIIQCLGQCDEEISWQELQRALAPNVLSKLLQKRQAEEVATAGLNGLVSCPFCPYVCLMEDISDKILVCMNPECGRESCRLCKAPSHVPLRCEEVESQDEEAHRKRIEEELTNAMIRECFNCKTRYMKEDGCNKMTCPKCRALMCYLCKQPVKDYSHFYGQGSGPGPDKKCPLWSDTQTLHRKEVAEAAARARGELKDNNIQLKADPTKGIADPTTIKPNPDRIPGAFGFLQGNIEAVRAQQHMYEHMIRNQHQRAVHAQAHGMHAAQQHHGGYMAGMVARMGEIYRMREEGRVRQRLARRAEMAALRDLRIHNWIPRGDNQAAAGGGAQPAAAVPAPVPHAVAPPPPPEQLQHQPNHHHHHPGRQRHHHPGAGVFQFPMVGQVPPPPVPQPNPHHLAFHTQYQHATALAAAAGLPQPPHRQFHHHHPRHPPRQQQMLGGPPPQPVPAVQPPPQRPPPVVEGEVHVERVHNRNAAIPFRLRDYGGWS